MFVHGKVNTANNNHACACVVMHITIAFTLQKNATSLRGEALMQHLNAVSTRCLLTATLSHMHLKLVVAEVSLIRMYVYASERYTNYPFPAPEHTSSKWSVSNRQLLLGTNHHI